MHNHFSGPCAAWIPPQLIFMESFNLNNQRKLGLRNHFVLSCLFFLFSSSENQNSLIWPFFKVWIHNYINRAYLPTCGIFLKSLSECEPARRVSSPYTLNSFKEVEFCQVQKQARCLDLWWPQMSYIFLKTSQQQLWLQVLHKRYKEDGFAKLRLACSPCCLALATDSPAGSGLPGLLPCCLAADSPAKPGRAGRNNAEMIPLALRAAAAASARRGTNNCRLERRPLSCGPVRVFLVGPGGQTLCIAEYWKKQVRDRTGVAQHF